MSTEEAQFNRYRLQNWARIPLRRSLPLRARGSLEIYCRFADAANSCLLESISARKDAPPSYSIIGLPTESQIRVADGRFERLHRGRVIDSEPLGGGDEPLGALQRFMAARRAPPLSDLPVFQGGVVGYFAYDLLRYVESRLSRAPAAHPLGTPDVLLLECDRVAVLDPQRQILELIVQVDAEEEDGYRRGVAALDEMEARLEGEAPEFAPLDMSAADDKRVAEEARCHFDRESYAEAIERIREYILAGDVMQVVPSRRLSVDFSASPLDYYRALRELNPSPYMYFFDFEDFHVVGSSPEILARLRDGIVSTRPIAGTRRRGRGAEDARRMEKELLADPKERAEHLMLIDLGRNDIGRIAEIGSVRLSEKMRIEHYSHVMHIVSTVTGRLREGLDAMDALRAILPVGTLSGAPKIRAMEIIDELEPVRRGLYGGAVGYVSWFGDMDTAVAIRTVVIKDGRLHAQVGGGIVADSDPALEWMETENKARALLCAVEVARAAASGGA